MSGFPPPWTVKQISGGYKVLDANGQSLAYVYGRETKAAAGMHESRCYIVGPRGIVQDLAGATRAGASLHRRSGYRMRSA